MTTIKSLAFSARTTLIAFVLATGFLASVANAQAGKAPVPTSKRQQEIANVLEDGFRVAKAVSASERQQLVKSLSKTASDPALPKDELYVVLTTVIEQSQQLRDLPTMTGAVDQLVAAFEVDSFAERTTHLVKYLDFVNTKTASTLKPVFEAISALAISAAADNRYRDAEGLLDKVDAKLVTLKVPASSKQLLTDLRKEIAASKENFEAFQQARSVLETKPDDPDANFTVGRWLAIEEANWLRALPYLAKASKSSSWQAAAKLELSPGADAVKVGDAWWDIVEKESDPAKGELLRHSGYWYQQALPKLSTLVKKRTEQRLSQIAANKSVNRLQSNAAQRVLRLDKEARQFMPVGSVWVGTGTGRDSNGRNFNNRITITVEKITDGLIQGKFKNWAGESAIFFLIDGRQLVVSNSAGEKTAEGTFLDNELKYSILINKNTDRQFEVRYSIRRQ